MGKVRKSRCHKNKRHTRRTRRMRRGGAVLDGAPMNYSLAGSWPSQASLGQGADFFKYHDGQHGGYNPNTGAPLSAIDHSALDQSLRGPARINGLDGAMQQIAGLSDAQYGGKRSKKSRGGKRSKKSRGGKRSKKSRGGKRSKKSRGGALGYSPFPSQGMLLSGSEYAQAGLNPEWKSSVEFDDAMIRGGL